MARNSDSLRQSRKPIALKNLGVMGYTEAWDMQHLLAQQRADDKIADTFLIVEHPHVFTAGRRTDQTDRPEDGSPVVDVDRGGKITWHGRGQLVGYPIIRLADPIDVVNYVRRLEEALISVCSTWGVNAGRVDGRSGVWCPADANSSLPFQQQERKIAAIGIRVAKKVTMHGFALNCDCDLSAYQQIIPCGIPDAGVTSLSLERGYDISVDDVTTLAASTIIAAIDGDLPIHDHSITHSTERVSSPK